MVWWQIALLAAGVGFLTGAAFVVGLVAWVSIAARPLRAEFRRQMTKSDG